MGGGQRDPQTPSVAQIHVKSDTYHKAPQPSVGPHDPGSDIICKFVSKGLKAVHRALESGDVKRAKSHLEILMEMVKGEGQ